MRLIQITDTHLFATHEGSLLGVKTFDSFSAVLQLLKNDINKPDAIILSGDLSQDNTKASYLRLVTAMEDFSPTPVYFVPGNHDDIALMARWLPSKNISDAKQRIINGWNMVLLSSQLPGQVKGNLDSAQMDFLVASLEKYPNTPALVVFHHQPVPVGSAWLDQYVLANAEAFWATLASYPQVKVILFGHVHQICEGKKQGVSYYSTPSTCIQFKVNHDDFALDNVPPGYRWVNLSPDGKFETGVCRLDHYVGDFDPNAKGY